MNNEVLALILGGGQGSRLFPLTQHRSKPAVPIGGSYRLIDIPISNCLHADIRRIFVLTQFNSASLNRHISQTYRMDLVQPGLRRDPRRRADARQPELVPGHGRRGAPGGAPLRALRRRLLPDPRRRSSLPDGLLRAGRRARRSQRRHHHRRAAGHDRRRLGDGHLPLRPQRPDRRLRGEAERASGSTRSARASRRARRSAATSPDKPFVASMGIYVFSRDVLLEVLEQDGADRLRPRDHPGGARPLPRQRAPVPRLLGRRRHRRVVLRRQHHADAARRAVQASTIPRRPIYTHARFLPGSRLQRLHRRANAIIAEGCYLDRCDDRGIGRRHPHQHPGGRDDPPVGAARRRLLRSRR